MFSFYLRNNKLILFITIGLCILFALNTANAQKYNFVTYQVSNGLPINSILDVKQVSNGNLWIGTMNGVCVYDGLSFKKIEDSYVLSKFPISKIIETKNHEVWIGTHGKGLVSYSGAVFKYYNTGQGLSNSFITDLCSDSNGNVWIATNNGLNKWDGKSFQSIYRSDGLMSDSILKIACDKKGGIWIATTVGLSYYFNNRFINYTKANGLTKDLIYSIYVDKSDQLWFSTHGCLSKFDSEKFTNYNFNEKNKLDKIKSITQDHTGQIWIASSGNGFGKFNNGNFEMINISDGLVNNLVNAITEDREGNFWLATQNGLAKFSGNRFITYSTDDGLSANNILSLYTDKLNKLWIGTNGGGLNQLADNSIFVFPNSNDLLHSSIWCIYNDHKNQIWLGTSNGAIKYNEQKKDFSVPYKETSRMAVYSILESITGEFYFGTDKGLLILKNKIFTKIGSADGLVNNKIRVLFQDSKGTIWIGTMKGVYCLDETNKIVNLSTTKNIPYAPITSIIEDQKNNILISTYDSGLVIYHNKNSQLPITIINQQNGLNSNRLLFCFFDADKKLWLGSTQGIEKINWNNYLKTSQLEIEYYDKSSGYKGVESNTAVGDLKGNSWFGTVNGLIKYNQKAIKTITPIPLISIKSVQLFSKNTNWKERNDSIDQVTGLPSRLVLKYNENNISFSYNGVYLSAPDEVTYSCMLKGFENNWQPPTKHYEVYYANLPAGEYVFKVKASVNGKQWSEPTSFFFKIRPPWWKTSFAYLLYFISGICLLYGLLKLRTQNLEKSKNMLSKKVIERTRELNAINIELSKLSLVASETDNIVLIFDKDLILEYANAGFTKVTGYSIDEIIHLKGRSINELTFHEHINDVLQAALRDRESKVYESQVTKKNGETIWTSATLTPIFDSDGKLKNVVLIDTEITLLKKISEQLKEALEERGSLLREIHHRVKNNLQIIISLFNLQSNYITDDNALKALKEGQDRIKSMALIHERFYQSEGLSKIDFNEYIKRLAENLFLSYNISQDKIKLRIDAERVALDIDTAVPCGLIVNELISNALKYAFINRENGEVFISFHNLDETYCRLIIGDNGIGLSNNFDFENSDTLGILLIKALTDQIDGKLSFENKNGLKFTLDFKKHI